MVDESEDSEGFVGEVEVADNDGESVGEEGEEGGWLIMSDKVVR